MPKPTRSAMVTGRPRFVRARLSDAELDLLRAAARGQGQRLGTWAREALLRAARGERKP